MNSLSNFFKRKERICKCGHNKKEHYKNPEKIFKILSECNKCKCSDYVKRDRPNLGDKLSLGYGIFVIGFGIFCMFMISPILNSNTEMKIPIKTMGLILESLIIIGMIYISSLITPYFDTKRRKIYPIEKDEQK